MDIHPFEAYYLNVKKSGIDDVVTTMKAHLVLFQDIYDKVHPKKLTDSNSCGIPFHYQMVENALTTIRRKENLPDLDAEMAIRLTVSLQILVQWSYDKSIYKVTDQIFNISNKNKIAADIPFARIRLPRQQILFQFPDGRLIVAYYDYHRPIGSVNQTRPGDHEPTHIKFVEISLPALLADDRPSYGSLSFSFTRMEYIELDRLNLNEYHPDSETIAFLSQLIFIIQYMNRDEDIVKIVHPGMRPQKHFKKTSNNQHPVSIQIPQQTEKQSVSIIEHWEQEPELLHQGGIHKSPRPHFRSGHFHTFMVGKGRGEKRVKFIPDISVKGAKKSEREIPRRYLVK
jgi:hypothetical protein